MSIGECRREVKAQMTPQEISNYIKKNYFKGIKLMIIYNFCVLKTSKKSLKTCIPCTEVITFLI